MSYRIGIIGGSGLGSLVSGEAGAVAHQVETPFGPASDSIFETQWEGTSVFLLSRHGPGHLLNPSAVPYRANIFAMKKLGVTHLIASGAVGSLREQIKPRDLVIPEQIIDRTVKRASTFFETSAVHVEMAEPFCPVLRQILIEAGEQVKGEPGAEAFNVHGRGCYVAMEGPAFSTKAESLMHRLMGGDVIGMTAMPEAKLAREAEISYGLVALATDYDCWRNKPVTTPPAGGTSQASLPPSLPADKHELLREIMGHLQAATQNALRLIRRAVSIISSKGESLPPSPAHSALELAIWSEKSKISTSEVERLAPLWVKYF